MGKRWSFNFRILLSRQDDLWTAHCLELDLVTAALTEEEAIKDIADVITEQVRYCIVNDNLDRLFRSAPKEIWDEYRACEKTEGAINRIIKAPPKGTDMADFPAISFSTSACRSGLSPCHA